MVMIPSYHKHLEDRKRRTLVMSGAVANSALSQSLLRVVFLDDPEGIAAFGDAIAANWPALIDLGATYGTAFLDSVRDVVGTARLEQPPYVTVSMVARMNDALQWMDMDKIHPVVLERIKQGILARFQQVIFVRFPANEAGLKLGTHCVNEDGEIQVFFMPEDDPVLTYLTQRYGIRTYEVRSSNITGRPEEPFAPGAVEYACAIAAPIVAINSFEALEAQMIDQALYKQGLLSYMRRKRFGSFPIIRIPQRSEDNSAKPVISIVRAGNTAPATLYRIIEGCFPEAEAVYSEEKHGVARVEYDSPYLDPEAIRKDLLRAASDFSAPGLDQIELEESDV
jgi:hypothetical protein